jgi:hypothetical protein
MGSCFVLLGAVTDGEVVGSPILDSWCLISGFGSLALLQVIGYTVTVTALRASPRFVLFVVRVFLVPYFTAWFLHV